LQQNEALQGSQKLGAPTWGAMKATIKGQFMSEEDRRWISTDPQH